MDRTFTKLKSQRSSVRLLCRRLQWVFFGILAIYAIVIIAIAGYMIILPQGFSLAEPETPLIGFSVLLNLLAGGLTLFLLGLLLRKIGQGSSPFSTSSVRLLMTLGIVLLLCVASELLISPGTQVGAVGDNSQMAFFYGESSSYSLCLDIKSLLASIACFAFAAIFRYGSTLQETTDDLV